MNGPIEPAVIRDPSAAAATWLLRFVEAPPDEGAERQWRRWLDSDPACRIAYADAYQAWQALGDAENAPWLVAMAREASADLHQRTQSRRRLGRRGRLLAVASVVLALVVGCMAWWYALSPEVYATGVGERRTVQLEDGSQISLDADTQVRVAYSHDYRRLRLLRGRVVCAVAKNPLRPFSVRAADKVVVATGTKFSVELVSDQVRVVLYQGHVAVLDAGGSDGSPAPVHLKGGRTAADVALVPGRELVVPDQRNTASVTPVNPVQSLSWEHGQLYFDNEPLALAVERVNRYSHTRVAVGDAAAAHVRISGVFTAGDTDAFLSGVTTVFPLRVVNRNGVQTLEGNMQ